jgi:SAM-dependent methyltransferase
LSTPTSHSGASIDPLPTRTVIERLYRNLRERGAIATLRLAQRRLAIAASTLADCHFDAAFGTETRAVVENADLRDVESPNKARGIRYQPTRAIPFRRLLRAARIPSEGGFVDLGCGKGRACMLAAMHGFSGVVGIDYSPALCRIAERNLDILRARTGRHFHSSIRAMDAADYAFARGDTTIYLYNPFDAGVLSAVVTRLEQSLAAHPRCVWLVYQNPVWRGVIEGRRGFTHTGDWTYGGCEFAVYRSDGARAPR